MCFSATGNIVASAGIAAVGVATLRHVPRPRAALLAAMPLLFALHQFTEAFVWMGLEGRIGAAALRRSAFLFMLYAQGILPLLMPLAVLLVEPPGRRRMGIIACTLLGVGLAAWTSWAVISFPTRAFVEHHSIAYRNPLTGGSRLGAVYVVATCGALLLSSHRAVRWFGIANVAGLGVVALAKGYAFTSVWCLYAALVSTLLWWQFRDGQLDEVRRAPLPA